MSDASSVSPAAADVSTAPRSVVISGSSGMVGTALRSLLEEQGHSVSRLVRSRSARSSSEVSWDPPDGAVDLAGLEGKGAVVHLAGAGVADSRWSAKRKALLRSSRVPTTRLLAESLAGLRERPSVLVSASAVGYYGDQGDELLDEDSARGEGFLAELCEGWEEATRPAAEAGIRVVHLRIGVVLSRAGGALGKMLPAFRLGLGGRLGDGQQWMSWVGLRDLLRIIYLALTDESLRGAVNAVAPEPARNAEFTRTLGQALGRPTIFPVPAVMLRLALGELADEALLASARVMPERLLASGFSFETPGLAEALRTAVEE